MKKRGIPTSKSCGVSRFVFFAFLLAAFFLTSCASKPRIADFVLQNGVQQYFVHQITVKKPKCFVQFDATIHVRDSQLIDNPVVRYMMYDQIFGQEPQNVLLCFESNGKEYSCSKARLLYKDAELNGQRYEMEMLPADFTDLAYQTGPVLLVFKNLKTGELLSKVEAKPFRDALIKLRYVINQNETLNEEAPVAEVSSSENSDVENE